MFIDHLYEWLAFTFVGWVVISLIATPFIGRFLAGALHEREEHHRRADASPLPPSVSAPTPVVLSSPAAQAPRVEAAASHQ